MRHQVRGLRPDPGQAEPLGDGGDDGHGAVDGDGQHALDRVCPRDFGHRSDVAEVEDDRHVGVGEPGRLRVGVHGDHAQPQLFRAQDRTPLVSPGSDEQNGPHRRRC